MPSIFEWTTATFRFFQNLGVSPLQVVSKVAEVSENAVEDLRTPKAKREMERQREEADAAEAEFNLRFRGGGQGQEAFERSKADAERIWKERRAREARDAER